ncbi:hypothetical protein ACU686_11970 [Yinghuangia aomiensis]
MLVTGVGPACRGRHSTAGADLGVDLAEPAELRLPRTAPTPIGGPGAGANTRAERIPSLAQPRELSARVASRLTRTHELNAHTPTRAPTRPALPFRDGLGETAPFGCACPRLPRPVSGVLLSGAAS